MSDVRIKLASVFAALALVELANHHGGAAYAQSREVAVLSTAPLDPKLNRLAQAVDPVLLARLGERGVKIAAHPALDLPSVQLARDCVGETPQCLRSLTDDLGANALIVPSLKRAGRETVLTILYFDAKSGDIRIAARQHGGQDVERAILDDVRDALHELLQPESAGPPLREPAAKAAVSEAQLGPPQPAGAAEREPRPVEPVRHAVDSGPPVLPIALTVGGGLIAAGGLVFALLADSSKSEYERAPVNSKEEIDAAFDQLATAREQAAIANIGLAVGGLATAAGLALFLLQPDEEREPAVAVLPLVGRGELTLRVSGRPPALSW